MILDVVYLVCGFIILAFGLATLKVAFDIIRKPKKEDVVTTEEERAIRNSRRCQRRMVSPVGRRPFRLLGEDQLANLERLSLEELLTSKDDSLRELGQLITQWTK